MIRVDNLRMAYRSNNATHQVVKGVSLNIAGGAVYTLLGPSGCGKTTTLRCVAGLERPDSGEIVIADQVVFSSTKNIWLPPHERKIGMVFQSYAIWPHMTVFQNVAFPLRYIRPRLSAKDMEERVRAALELVKLGGYEERPAPFLSGGQQQRLALARALVAEPRVLLLDEPLSNLDAKLREEMRAELVELVQRLKVTTLFVTHEQTEALTMSDVIGVMSEGQLVQEGSPETIYSNPQRPFVANFVGKMNFVHGTVAGLTEAGNVMVKTEVGPIMAKAAAGFTATVNTDVVVAIRPEHVALDQVEGDAGDAAVATHLTGEVKTNVYVGNIVECVVTVGETAWRVQLHPARMPPRGTSVNLSLPMEHCVVLPAEHITTGPAGA